MVNAAVMGYGTIGSGVVKVLDMNHDLIAKRVGQEVNVKYILDLREFPGDAHEDIVIHDVNVILNDPDVTVVVETMGGTGAAYRFVKAALEAGKHVATSNKALVEKYGVELMQIAAEQNVNFFYEASVGGGIPIIRTLDLCLTGDEIEEIAAIINGTTNYILTKMADEGAAFEDVLKEAQALGFAEADPTADVEGHDVGRKIAILTSQISGHNVNFEDMHVEGISKISADDMLYAKKMNRCIKLLAICRKTADTYSIIVAPFLLEPENPLSAVNGVLNAVFVRSNALGDSMYYGSGAGMLPTASAVVGDIVEIVKHPDESISPKWDGETLVLSPWEEETYAYFVRLERDTDGKEVQAAEVFGQLSYLTLDEKNDEFGLITAPMPEKVMQEKLGALSGVRSVIRLG